MAQNRINKAGSIFTRIDGLIKGGLIPYKERPLWYDIYKAFPPKRDPLYRTILAGYETPTLPRKVFYREDEIRAFYGKNLWPQPKASYLNSTLTKPISELFVETYTELAKKGISEENIVRATIEELKTKGHTVSFIDEIKKEDKIEEEPTPPSIAAKNNETMSEEERKLSDSITQANLNLSSSEDQLK